MPILMPNGEYKSRKDLIGIKQTNKKTKRHKKQPKTIKTIHSYPRKITQDQATRIYDTQLSRRLRDMTRED